MRDFILNGKAAGIEKVSFPKHICLGSHNTQYFSVFIDFACVMFTYTAQKQTKYECMD